MKKQTLFLSCICALVIAGTIHGMDKKLVRKKEQKPKPRSAMQEAALQFGKKAAEGGHKKTADRVLKHVPGPTAVYTRAGYSQDPQKKSRLLEQAATCPSAKPSSSKEAAADRSIAEYLEKLIAYRKKLEQDNLEAWDKKATALTYKACRNRVIALLAESLKAKKPRLENLQAVSLARNAFLNDERFEEARIPESVSAELEPKEDEESSKLWD